MKMLDPVEILSRNYILSRTLTSRPVRVLEVKIPFIFSIRKLVFNNNFYKP